MEILTKENLVWRKTATTRQSKKALDWNIIQYTIRDANITQLIPWELFGRSPAVTQISSLWLLWSKDYPSEASAWKDLEKQLPENSLGYCLPHHRPNYSPDILLG